MALVKCPKCGAEISDKAILCPKCGTPANAENNENLTANQTPQVQSNEEPDFVQKQKKNSKWFWGVIAALGIMLGILAVVLPSIDGVDRDPGPKYYVAQIPSEVGNASFEWTGVIDGYIHKDKECCQNVVNYWNSSGGDGGELNAQVVKINPDSTAYKNYMGQSVSYEVALNYCPLCRGW